MQCSLCRKYLIGTFTSNAKYIISKPCFQLGEIAILLRLYQLKYKELEDNKKRLLKKSTILSLKKIRYNSLSHEEWELLDYLLKKPTELSHCLRLTHHIVVS